ncbi:MAG: NAD(P)/FAD-dependent oxidoreductase, partial [Desulfobacula sp.]
MNAPIFDTIIIGSGISGMAAGIILAREGEKVLVLEQHRVAGGLTQTYSRNGCIFPTGVHRLGSLEPGQPLWYYFKYLRLLDRLALEPLCENCFEHVFFPEKDYRVPIGRSHYREKLLEYFPEQKKGIERYFSDFETAISHISLYNPCIVPEKNRALEYTGPLRPYLESIGISGRLISLMTANSPLYGLSSTECPILTHFVISDSYLNSSFRINEGQTPFSTALKDSLEAFGGKLRVNARVKQISVEEKSAKGVVLISGEVILAGKVIFSGHPGLLTDICPPEHFRPVFRKKLDLESTQGVFGVALKWKNDSCPVKENDAYIYDSWDVDYLYRRTNILEDDGLGMVYLSSLPGDAPSLGSKKHISVTALTGISDRETQILRAYYNESKKTAYIGMKDKLIGKVLDHIALACPDVKARTEVVASYSSLTFQRYTLTKGGSAYGIKKTARRFLEGWFNPATRVRN